MNNTYLSRRSFTQKLTQAVFAIVGAKLTVGLSHLVASNPPRGTPLNRIGTGCGNGGEECRGTCSLLGVGSGFWVKCCYFPGGTGTWKCCTYTDICSTTDSEEKKKCRTDSYGGYISATQEEWCNNKTLVYVCTVSACSNSFPTYASCAAACAGDRLHGGKV